MNHLFVLLCLIFIFSLALGSTEKYTPTRTSEQICTPTVHCHRTTTTLELSEATVIIKECTTRTCHSTPTQVTKKTKASVRETAKSTVEPSNIVKSSSIAETSTTVVSIATTTDVAPLTVLPIPKEGSNNDQNSNNSGNNSNSSDGNDNSSDNNDNNSNTDSSDGDNNSDDNDNSNDNSDSGDDDNSGNNSSDASSSNSNNDSSSQTTDGQTTNSSPTDSSPTYSSPTDATNPSTESNTPSVFNELPVSNNVSNRALGIGLGVGIGSLAALGLAGLIVHNRKKKTMEPEQEMSTRWRPQSFLGVVASVAARLSRTPSTRSQASNTH